MLLAQRTARGRNGAPPFQSFQQLDRDRGGMIEGYEWSADPDFFHWMDTDGNGKLSREEYFDRINQYENAHRFYRWDTNRDGRISREEWRAEPDVFMSLDTNQDSMLTREEFLSRDVRFRTLDENRDAMVTQSEWRGTRAQFRNLDLNGDGVLSAEEYFQRGGEQDRERRFREWDTNRNGVIEGFEWHAPTGVFHQLDRDQNSALSFDEFVRGSLGNVNVPAYRNAAGDQDFRLLDRNNDGMISRNEWQGSVDAFYRYDTNGDMMLSPSEFAGGAAASTGVTGTQDADTDFRRLDRNGDGVISSREWPAGDRSFGRLDRNNDGMITRDEFVRRP